MPSVVQICNMALSHLGAEALVSSIDPPDGSVEAGHCRTFYGAARTEAIELGGWPWAVKRAALAPVALPAGTVWQYAYALPSDCLRAQRVLPFAGATWVFSGDWPPEVQFSDWLDDRGTTNFDVEGEVLLTNEPDAVLRYLVDVTDTTKFSAGFSAGLAMLLAGYLAGPIIKGQDGTRIGAQWRQAGLQVLAAAAARDANASAEPAGHLPDTLRVRA